MEMSGYDIQSKRYFTRLEAARDPVTGRFTQGGGHPGRKVGSRNKHRRLSAQERLLEYEARAHVSYYSRPMVKEMKCGEKHLGMVRMFGGNRYNKR